VALRHEREQDDVRAALSGTRHGAVAMAHGLVVVAALGLIWRGVST
jgi:hypothetical protein